MEIFGELLWALLDSLAQVVIQVAAESAIGFLLNTITATLSISEGEESPLEFTGYLLLGVLGGGLSLVISPHSFVANSRFHGATLLLTPVLTAFVMTLVRKFVIMKGKQPARISKFGNAFAFAYGMAVIRFLFTHK